MNQIFSAGLLLLGATVLPLRGQPLQGTDHLHVQGAKVLLVKNGQSRVLDQDMTLSNGFKVTTNAVVVLRQGVEKQLADGQKLTLDGWLLAADGRLVQLEDHVMLQNGKVTVVEGGRSRSVTAQTKLADGSVVTPDGFLVRPDGRRTRLLDGQMLKLNGTQIPAQDFVMLRQGKVVLQKDGSLMTLAPTQTMMMSDNTRVKGNGTVTRSDGSTFVLSEGQRLNVAGAVTSPPR